MAQAICAMPFLELYLEDDCTNHSGNKVMKQHFFLPSLRKNSFFHFISALDRMMQGINAEPLTSFE